jgi:hypothetical protein
LVIEFLTALGQDVAAFLKPDLLLTMKVRLAKLQVEPVWAAAQ